MIMWIALGRNHSVESTALSAGEILLYADAVRWNHYKIPNFQMFDNMGIHIARGGGGEDERFAQTSSTSLLASHALLVSAHMYKAYQRASSDSVVQDASYIVPAHCFGVRFCKGGNSAQRVQDG